LDKVCYYNKNRGAEMNEQQLQDMIAQLLELAEKHEIPVSDRVLEFFEDLHTAEFG
jgi:hypothetical protein